VSSTSLGTQDLCDHNQNSREAAIIKNIDFPAPNIARAELVCKAVDVQDSIRSYLVTKQDGTWRVMARLILPGSSIAASNEASTNEQHQHSSDSISKKSPPSGRTARSDSLMTASPVGKRLRKL
jgi:hypothetical protein